MKELERCRPEQVGISSEAVIKCLEHLEKARIPLHSLMLLRYGKVAAEVYYEPCGKNRLHRFYSTTKSFTSIAIGCLIGEGKISLQDSITSYFPEYLPDPVPEWLSQTTIKDMLEMQSCHSVTTYKSDWSKNWVESFFRVEPDHCPGTVFSYDTSSSHTLAALVEKISGMEMLDYLRVKCLDAIGFSKEAYITKDPFGVSWGGSGLMATTEDLARFSLLLMNLGKWEGEQLVPAWYIEEAVSCQVPNIIHGNELDDVQGYGYQFWKLRKGYACRGKGSQMAICIPEEDFICVTTADTTGIPGGSQKILDAVFDFIEASLDQKPVENRRLQEACFQNRKLRPLLSNQLYIPEKRTLDCISGAWYGIADSTGNFDSVMVRLDEKQGTLHWSMQGAEYVAAFGLGNYVTGDFPKYHQFYAGAGQWLNKDTLYIEFRILGEEPCLIRFQLVFRENQLTLHMLNTGELCFKEFDGWYGGVRK